MQRNAFIIIFLLLIIMAGCSDDAPTSSDAKREHRQELSDELDTQNVIDRAKRESAATDNVGANELVSIAQQQIQVKDPAAQLMYAKYSWGDRDLCFKSATFRFNSPALKKAGERKSSYQIKLRGRTVQDIDTVSTYWMDGNPIDPSPQKPLEAALAADFGTWWKEHPQANLYMQLRPHLEYDKYKPKDHPWLWIITGSGPGVPEDYRVYIAPHTMEVLGTDRKEVAIR